MTSHGPAPRLNPSKWWLSKPVSPLSNLFFHRCTHLSWSCVCGPHPVQTNEPEVPTPSSVPICSGCALKEKKSKLPSTREDFLGTMQPAVQLISCANVKSFYPVMEQRKGHFAGPTLFFCCLCCRWYDSWHFRLIVKMLASNGAMHHSPNIHHKLVSDRRTDTHFKSKPFVSLSWKWTQPVPVSFGFMRDTEEKTRSLVYTLCSHWSHSAVMTPYTHWNQAEGKKSISVKHPDKWLTADHIKAGGHENFSVWGVVCCFTGELLSARRETGFYIFSCRWLFPHL